MTIVKLMVQELAIMSYLEPRTCIHTRTQKSSKENQVIWLLAYIGMQWSNTTINTDIVVSETVDKTCIKVYYLASS